MDKLKIPHQAQPFIEALRELIRTGALASPALGSSRLLDLLVVRRQAGRDATPSRRAYAFIEILRHVTLHRLEGKDIETALILFGLDQYAGVPLQDRYRSVAKLYSPYWTWENFRKEPLTRHLLAVYLALEREAALPPPVASAKPASSGLVGQDWVMERFEATYNLPTKPGDPVETQQTRRLRAISDEVDVWRQNAYWRERGVTGTPQVSLFGSGAVSVTDTHVDPVTNMRIYITEVVFPRPVPFGESVEFTLVKRVQADFEQLTSGWDWYGLVTLKSPVESARIGVHFPVSRRPRVVWQYTDMMSGLERHGAPTAENRLNIDSSGYVECTWSNLLAGYSYGISIEW